MRELWDETAGMGSASGEAIEAGALGVLAADQDLLQRLFDFTLEHGPTLMDFDGSFGIEAHAGRW